MKKLFILSIINCCFINLEAQSYYAIFMHSKELKSAKVNTLRVYLMYSNSDSTLLREDTYDTLGNIAHQKIYSKKGDLTGQNNYEYDVNHYLVKSINTDGGNQVAIANYTNDAKGKLLAMETIIDGHIIFRTKNEFDVNMQLIKSTGNSSTGDSLVLTNFYNREGEKVKTVIFDKKPDSTVHSYQYNQDGQVSNLFIKDFKGVTNKIYSYNLNAVLTEIAISKNIKGKKTRETESYTYYPNSLTRTYIKVIKTKPEENQRAYYTFY